MNTQSKTMPRLYNVIAWIAAVALFIIIGRYILVNYTISDSKMYILAQDHTYYPKMISGPSDCLLVGIDYGGEACGSCVDNKFPNAGTIIRDGRCYREL